MASSRTVPKAVLRWIQAKGHLPEAWHQPTGAGGQGLPSLPTRLLVPIGRHDRHCNYIMQLR